MFKKRAPKGNIRKVEDDEDFKAGSISNSDGNDSEAELADNNIIANVRAKQLQRKKVKYEFSDLNDHDVINVVKGNKISETSKSIQTMMGNQFSVKNEESNKFNAHEKIMENYINQKLGIK